MSELPKGYRVVNYHDGSELLVGPGGAIMSWYMDGTPEGYYFTERNYGLSKEDLKENLAAINAYLDGAK